MVNASRFSTSSCPSRSNMTPRGARSESLRRWLFSAIRANAAPSTTWKYQNATASVLNTAMTTTVNAVSRAVVVRRSVNERAGHQWYRRFRRRSSTAFHRSRPTGRNSIA